MAAKNAKERKKGTGVSTKRRKKRVPNINRCKSVCRNRRHEERVRLPRPVRHERGEGWGEGCPTIVYGLAVAERLLSPTLSSVPNGGEGAGGPGTDGRHYRKE